MEKWLETDGERFLSQIGIKKGQIVVDFGCGEGSFSIPAAKVVGETGKVYSLDKDSGVFHSLFKKAEKFNLKNIEKIKVANLEIPLENEIADAALLYDVLHYLNSGERKKVYAEIHRILKKSGFLSVYPKHNKDDFPLWSLADMDTDDISKEIQNAGFRVLGRFHGDILHDGYINRGVVLKFSKV